MNANTALLHIVAAATGAIGVGSPLCLDQQYLDVSVQYAASVMRAMAAASRVPSWCRRVVAPWLKEVRELDGFVRRVEGFMGKVIRERREREEQKEKEGREGEKEGGEKEERPQDMLQWTMDAAGRFGLDAEWKVVRAYLGFVFAAIHSTTVVATNV